MLSLALMKSSRNWIAAAWLLCAVFAAVAGSTFLDYGVTWDEGVQSRYGELVVNYFTSGFRDTACNRFLDLKLYGPLFEIIPAAASRLCPYGLFEVRHAAIAASALLALIGLVQFGRRFANPAVPFFAVLALLATPHFYGHAFNNSKDIPFACGFIWSMERIAALVLSDERTRRRSILAGVVIGLTMAVRVEAILLLVILAMALVYRRGAMKPAARSLLLASATSWVTMVAFWPWAQESPILNPLRALFQTVGFASNYPLLFEGQIVWSHDLPRRYLVEMLAITMPVAILLMALAGVAIAARSAMLRDADGTMAFLTLVWFFLPFVLFFIRKPHVYDGIRHFLFMLPAMAMFAAVIAAEIARRWRVGALVAAALLLLVVPSMIALHPYQSAYYNAFVGGVAGASEKFETDYWASSYREGMLWIADHACGERPPRVLVAANSYGATCALPYAPPGAVIRFVFTRDVPPSLPAQYDYYLATTRYGFAANFPQTRVAHVVGRRGAVFSVIRGGCDRR